MLVPGLSMIVNRLVRTVIWTNSPETKKDYIQLEKKVIKGNGVNI